jgi:hypothetical protein
MTVEVLAGDDGGLSVHDHIERRRCELLTDEVVDPRPVSTAGFRYPVDVAVAIETDRIRLPQVVNTLIRDGENQILDSVDHFDRFERESGVYFVEMSAPMKLYLRVEAPVRVETDATETVVCLGRCGEVQVGARSYHEQPAGTITTTDDPVDVMRAVSYLGSALKTHTPDRSYPTLRGHPPELELGGRFDVPDYIEAPDSGLRIEVPPTLESVFPVTPLAYYLGAEVVPGMEPRLVAEGFEYPLESVHLDFETTVARVLKQTFFLDCITRELGPPLHERAMLRSQVDLPAGDVSDVPPGERLSAYLDVPYGTIEPYVPRWKLTAHVEPDAGHVSVLPYFVNDLAVIRTPSATPMRNTGPAAEVETAAIDSYMRCDGGRRSGTQREGPLLSMVQPAQTDSLEQAWVGEEVPVGASKTMLEAYRNGLAHEVREGGVALNVVLVCNDDHMNRELTAATEVYGSRDEVAFNVNKYHDLTCEQLALVLESDLDFLHYVGHIDEAGFQCADGTLDVHSISEVGIDSFFLNACSSYEQGMELIRKGSVGGVVTLDDVIDSGALRVGRTMAQLLNNGFPLRPALDIARERSIVGSKYIVVGDGNADIAHAEGLVPDISEIVRLPDGDRFEVIINTYPTDYLGIGGVYHPEIAENEEFYLVGSRKMTFTVSREQLRQFLNLEISPVRVDGEFTWSNRFDLDE